MSKHIKIIIVAIVVILIVAVAYFVFFKKYRFATSENKNEIPAVQNILPEATTTITAKPVAKVDILMPGYKLYKNSEFGFEIQYPKEWAVSEENIENVRGEKTMAFYFSPVGGSASGGKKSESDLRFAILPRDGLSYGLPDNGASSEVLIGGSAGVQQKWALPDGRRLWLLHPRYGLYGWSEDIGRIDIQSSAADPAGDTAIFEKMLNSFKLAH